MLVGILITWRVTIFQFAFNRNSSFQIEDDGGGGLENDDDYDALNDQTFGDAINGDWEAIHDTLVELDQNGNTNGADNYDVHDADIADLGEYFEFW